MKIILFGNLKELICLWRSHSLGTRFDIIVVGHVGIMTAGLMLGSAIYRLIITLGNWSLWLFLDRLELISSIFSLFHAFLTAAGTRNKGRTSFSLFEVNLSLCCNSFLLSHQNQFALSFILNSVSLNPLSHLECLIFFLGLASYILVLGCFIPMGKLILTIIKIIPVTFRS